MDLVDLVDGVDDGGRGDVVDWHVRRWATLGQCDHSQYSNGVREPMNRCDDLNEPVASSSPLEKNCNTADRG